MNTVVLVGRTTKDPSISYTPSQTAVAKFNLAVRRDRAEGADFPSITAFGKLAETIEKYVHKGDKIGVMGHIQTSSYEKDGQKIYTTDVIAEKIEFLNSKSDTQEAPESPHDGFNKLTNEDIPF